MKRIGFAFGLFAATAWMVGCARHNSPAPLFLDENSSLSTKSDSSQDEEINEYQRALAIYILSLPPKERAEWVSSALNEVQMNAMLDSLEIKPK